MDEAGEEAFVADGIDEAGDAFGVGVDSPKSGPCEGDGRFCAGNLETMLDVLAEFELAQGRQVIADGDALA